MKLITKLVRHYSNEVPNSTKQTKYINVNSLIKQFQRHFDEHSQKYLVPLQQTNTILPYTSRLTKTIINLQNVTADQKVAYFKRIKQSMLNHSFTPLSFVELCESLISFHFEGDEEVILQKVRDYAKHNSALLSPLEKDRFDRAYKFLMIEKAKGKVKFVDCPVKQSLGERSNFKEKLTELFRQNGIKQYSLSDWNTKREVKLRMKMGEDFKNIVIKGISQKGKKEDIELTAKRVVDLANKEQYILMVSSFNSELISQEQLQKQLLVDQSLYYRVDSTKVNDSKDVCLSVIKAVCNRGQLSNAHNLYGVELTPMAYLNAILSNQSEQNLKELFGYLKFNAFHLELEKLLLVYNIEKKSLMKSMFPFDFMSSLELEEKRFIGAKFPLEIKAKALVNFMKEKGAKRYHIYLDELQVDEYLSCMLFYQKQKMPASTIDASQNRDLATVKTKMALASVIHNLPIALPVLEAPINRYRQLMHPLTFRHRQAV